MNEIEKPKDGKLKKDEIALMARELVLVTLPHKDPGNVPVWSRRNGNIGLIMQPGYREDHKTGKPVCTGYPYGSIARLILYWIVTEVRRTGQQRLELGASLAEFMRKVGIQSDDTKAKKKYSGGKKSSAHAVHRQLIRLIHAKISFSRFVEEGGNKARQWLDMPVAKGGQLWWDKDDATQESLIGSFIILNDDFFKTIITNPVPVRMFTLMALRKSPLGLDLYAWANIESYKAQAKRQGRFVAWKLLHEQFGTELGTVKNFAAKAKRELQKIMCNCPSIKVSFPKGGVQIHAGSLPDVLPRDAQEALKPPPPTLAPHQKVPSSEAFGQAFGMYGVGTSELAMRFQNMVKEGNAEATDEAFISFIKQKLSEK
jgi:hypothetical protein